MKLFYGWKTYEICLSPVEAILFNRVCRVKGNSPQAQVAEFAGPILRITEQRDFRFEPSDYPAIWNQASKFEKKRLLKRMKENKAIENMAAAFGGTTVEDFIAQLIRQGFHKCFPYVELIKLLKVICLSAAARAEHEVAYPYKLLEYGLECSEDNPKLIKIPRSLVPELWFSIDIPTELCFLGLDERGREEVFTIQQDR